MPAHLLPLDRFLAGLIAAGTISIGQVTVLTRPDGGYALVHRDDAAGPLEALQRFSNPEDAEEIARYDELLAYRPLKTAPNLRRGWRLELADLRALRLALECFYPGRLAAFLLWQKNRLLVTSLRDTLNRQTGMYRLTQKITDEQALGMVGRFCRSDGGCARTILWRLNAAPGTPPLATLPPEKFDPARDQILAGAGEFPPAGSPGKCLPMLCQEACNLLVAEARSVVKAARSAA